MVVEIKDANLVDLQVALDAGAGEVTTGKLVHGRAFDLLRAMSALVVCNFRQDSGMRHLNRRAPDARSPLDLTDNEIAYIFDSLLACEATWHHGQTVSKAMNVCTYLKMNLFSESESCSPVYAYFDAVHCFVATIRYVILTAGVYEEGEFILSTLDNDVGKLTSNLGQQEVVTISRLKNAESRLMQESPRAFILLARVRFRIDLHTAINLLCKITSEEDVQQASQSLDAALIHLTTIQRTTPAVPIRKSSDRRLDDDPLDWDPGGIGFDHKAGITQSGAQPPTDVKLFSRAAAFDHYAKLLADLKHVCNILGSHLRSNGASLDVLGILYSMPSTNPGIIPRSVLAYSLFRGKDDFKPGEFFKGASLSTWSSHLTSTHAVKKDGTSTTGMMNTKIRNNEESKYDTNPYEIETFGLEANSNADYDCQSSEQIHNFDSFSSVRSAELLARAYISNRSRLRRKLRRLCNIWEGLCLKAERLNPPRGHLASTDTSIPSHLGSAMSGFRALRLKTKLMLLRQRVSHVLLGIDLHLYMPYELHMVYWFIGEMLNASTDLVVASGETFAIDYVSKNDVFVYNKADISVGEVHKKICKGLVLMLFALERMGYLIGPVQNSFTESEQCFLQRFDSLSRTDIMPARWSDYDEHVTGLTGIATDKILSAAVNCFLQAGCQARHVLNLQPSLLSIDQAKDLTAIELVAKANAVALRLLESQCYSAELAHNLHTHFVTLVLRQIEFPGVRDIEK